MDPERSGRPAGGPRPLQRARLTAVLGACLAAAAAALAACGGGDQAGVPIAEDCLQAWNSETASLTFGRHVYDSHQSKQAQVITLEPAEDAFTIRGDETCAVIFAVEASDPEFGDVGLVITRLGWASMKELARGEQARLDQVQADAGAAPNANLFPDGSLDPK